MPSLLAQVPLIFLTIANWDWSLLLAGRTPEEAWTGAYFALYWALTMLYFVVDLAWVALVPTCVKSPGVIIKVSPDIPSPTLPLSRDISSHTKQLT